MKKIVIFIVMIGVMITIIFVQKRIQISNATAMTHVLAEMEAAFSNAKQKGADSSDELMVLKSYVAGLKRIDTKGAPEDFCSDFEIYTESFEATLNAHKLGESTEKYDIQAEDAHTRMTESLLRIAE